jgi:ribosomal protein S18 acetylase RimI-like enzyme
MNAGMELFTIWLLERNFRRGGSGDLWTGRPFLTPARGRRYDLRVINSLGSIDSRIQSYLRAVSSRQRETAQAGPFFATFTPDDPNPFLNYALPDDGAAPSPGDVAALVSAYERRNLFPRLEYIARLAPAVEPALLAAGFLVEGRLPLMVCHPSEERELPPPEGIELVVPVADAELYAAVAVQNESYGAPPPPSEVVSRKRKAAAVGEIIVMARVVATREPVGAGICSLPLDGITEIAGIGVRAPFRRRGIAGALTAHLARAAFKAGVSVAFLMAAHEAEAGIYRRAGFSPIGEILHISRRPS